jgi:hypothetical protein
MKAKKIFVFFALVVFFNMYSNIVTATSWELGFRTMNSNGYALPIPVTVFTLDSSRNLVECASGSTGSDFSGSGERNVNGFADLGSCGTAGAMFCLDYGSKYYIKIGNKCIIITFAGGNAYGDMRFIYQDGPTESLICDWNTSNYLTSASYTWSEKTIILANDFGNDKASCYGNIYFNSTALNDIGISGTTLTRESGTFPHTIAGEEQDVNDYYRKWRKWSDNSSNISKTLSSGNYSLTATYAKQVEASLTNDFGGGIINVNSTTYASGSTAYLYDDANYTITAPYQTVNWVDYTFDHWSGTYNGTQNPLTYNNPDTDKNLTAYYIGTANQSPMNTHFTSSNGQYISLAWTDHPNTNVTQYQVWRSVTGGSTSAIATLNRGTTSYTDYRYIQNPNGTAKLFYAVKAYYAPSGTWNDPAYLLNRGDLDFNIAQVNDQLNISIKEVPLEYSIGNYPNPFNPTTTINYQLPENGFVTIKVYDMLGKEIATLVNESKSAGYYRVNFDASKFTSGIYIYTIKSNNYSYSKKMQLLK